MILSRFDGHLGKLVIFLLAASVLLGTRPGTVYGDEAYVGGGFPEIAASSDYRSIWRTDSGNSPSNATVTLAITGGGSKGITLAPQDVVFVMDHSGSLETYDPQVLRIIGAQRYVQNMVEPYDRAAVIKFDTTATIFRHLSPTRTQVIADLEALSKIQPQGQTNFQEAVMLLNNELRTYGKEGNQRIGVLFTDGSPDPPEKNVTIEIMNETRDSGIRLFTIGLGPVVDSSLLQWMADYTGGEYFQAENAEELVNIYLKISDQFYDFTAGANCTLRGELNRDLDYMNGTSNVSLGFNAVDDDGWTLVWDIGDLMIDELWSVRFNVASDHGDGILSVFTGESALIYTDWRGVNRTLELPDLFIEIIRALPPPLPPPPPPPLAATPPPLPPPPSVPVVAPSVNVAPVITATPNVTPITVGQTATVPVEYLLAGLATLGIAKRTTIKKKIIEKQRVSVGA